MTASDADAELMLRVREGDDGAFRELIERHQRVVVATIHRAIGDAWEAEDLAQRVFIQIYRSAHRYQPTAKFTTWMFTIVHNTIRNEYRRRSRHPAQSLDEVGEHLPDARVTNPAQDVAERELQERIQVAIGELPANQRTAVILCRFEGQSYEEIAQVLDCSVPAVKSLLHRARESLKEKLSGLY
jgi:RNA polymerase sigma-70 factor (ECF subfamily)